MAALPYMQLYPADYLADTQHLTTEEHGAYLLLLMNYWQTGKPLDNRKGKLAKIAKLSDERWTVVERSLREFFVVKRGIWIHERVEFDLQSVLAKSTKASFAGKESARKRANSRSPDPENGHLEEKESKSQNTSGKKVSGSNGENSSLGDVSGVNEGNVRSTNAQRSFNHTDTDTRHQTPVFITPELETSFEEFWRLYPKQPKGVGSKKSAKAKYAKIAQDVDPAILLEGLKRFVATKPDIGYIPYVTTWLNGERWTDEVTTTPTGPNRHLPMTDPTTGEIYCPMCDQTWPCLTEQRRSGSQF